LSRIEQLWYGKSKVAWLLLPLSAIFWLLSSLRRFAYQRGLLKQQRLNAPVIIVGNISVGGTGKTPFTLWLCRYLQQAGFRPGIISRGYGANISQPLLVAPGNIASEVGDEPLLLAQLSGCPVVVCPNRPAAGRFLLAQTDCNIIISDDGLQHYALARDLELVLVDGLRGLGNGWLLPAGPLRETAARLADVDLVIANSQMQPIADGVMLLKAAAAQALDGSGRVLSPQPVTLLAGIGNPERFVKTAEAAGFEVKACRFFADHHAFSPADLADISGPILMTEKDAVKCRAFATAQCFSLGVSAEPDQAVLTKLSTLLATLTAKTNR
jgi:tetraacyldisaccharide 4'-kinase